MSHNNTLYIVYAGNRRVGYSCIYETTKRSKADKFVHDLLKSDSDYDKVWISTKSLSKFDKRRDYDE